MIDTNVRSVKRLENGATILNKSTQKLGNLCNHCAMADHCEYRVRIRGAESAGRLTAPVTTCASYCWPIHFVSTIGLDAGAFNTVRIGEAWGKRLSVGDLVGLLDRDKKLVAKSRVRLLKVVPMTVEGLRQYAGDNHMLIHEPLDPDQAAEKLLKILRNNYGKMVFERNQVATVIGF